MGSPQGFDFGRESRRYLVDQFGEEAVTTFEYAAWKAVNRASRWPSDETAVRELAEARHATSHSPHRNHRLADCPDPKVVSDYLEDARAVLAALHGREETAGTEDGRG